jgi:APA family basic amino acid/polyamine antiporter
MARSFLLSVFYSTLPDPPNIPNLKCPVSGVHSMPWQVLGETEGAMAVAAGTFLPAWGVYFINIGALLAAATTINAVLAVVSRDVLALGRDLVFPSFFGKVNDRFKTPVRAVVLLGVISVAGIFIGETVVRYATVAALACLFMSLVVAIAIFLLPRSMKDRYEASTFKLKGGWHWLITMGGAFIFGVLIILASVDDPRSGLYFLILLVTGLIYYYVRRWHLRNKGVFIEDKLKKVDEI